ncbi:DNA mismatch repair protein MSH4 [Pseudohyphozyma bogoriensis]|nr:DNA mismatch repair protein MSH4 [Pseudohyphozyma bogoriensis]
MFRYADTPTFVKTLHLFTQKPPALILIPATFVNKRDRGQTSASVEGDQDATMLVKSLKDAWKDTTVLTVARGYWNEQAGYEFVTQLCVHDEQRASTILSVKSTYYALSAMSALLKASLPPSLCRIVPEAHDLSSFQYLEAHHSLIFPPRSLRITYAPLEGLCLIDIETSKNLELVSNLLTKNSKQTLLGLLDHCFTPMATRLLRTGILGPLTDVATIDARLDAVEEMASSEDRFTAIRKALEPLKKIDLDKLIGQIISARPRSPNSTADPAKESENKINRILHLRTLLSSLPSLRTAIQSSECKLLKTIHHILMNEQLDALYEEIGKTINADAVNGLQKGTLASKTIRIYAVRSERKMLLDVARETYKENVDDVMEMGESLAAETGIEIKVVWSGNSFVFQCDKAELEEKPLPRTFTNVNKKGKKVEFSSLELKKKNARINESATEVFMMRILDELLAEIKSQIASLYRASEGLAMLDMLASFADVSTKNNYVRPEFTDTLAIKSGRHPLHEQFRLGDGSFVPNDTYASDAASFQIVGGANMSGKSTLLRQIALLHIIAQIGCFVPAEYASFRPVYSILGRLDNDDSIEASMSTFSREMSSMAMILSSIQHTKQCLLIVDELGRGSSPLEGIGIAHALSEFIIKSKELSATLAKYPNVVSMHLEAEISRSEADFSLTFHHRVRDGTSPLTHYGLEIAKSVKMPSDILVKATSVSKQLTSLADESRRRSEGSKLAMRRRELVRLKATLKDLLLTRNKPGSELLEELRDVRLDTLRSLIACQPAPPASESASVTNSTGSSRNAKKAVAKPRESAGVAKVEVW